MSALSPEYLPPEYLRRSHRSSATDERGSRRRSGGTREVGDGRSPSTPRYAHPIATIPSWPAPASAHERQVVLHRRIALHHEVQHPSPLYQLELRAEGAGAPLRVGDDERPRTGQRPAAAR